MKKVLFATTALIATAGVAAADVSLGGFGYVGLLSKDGVSSVEHATRLTYSASTETDGGISMSVGGRLFTRENNDGDDYVAPYNNISIAAGGVRMTIGATNGAMRSHARTTAYHGFDNGNMLKVDNSVSLAQGDTGNNVHLRYAVGGMSAGISTDVEGTASEVGVSYKEGNVGFGVGMSSTGGWMANGSYSMDAVTLGVGLNSDEERVLSVTYTADALALNLGYENNPNGNRYGLQAKYALGGGANAIVNFAQNPGSDTDMGVGVMFSF